MRKVSNRRRKKESFISKLKNSFFTIMLTIAILFGIQLYTAPLSFAAKSGVNLKFAQVSDVHFSTYEENTSYKLLAESKNLLIDVIDQINNTIGIEFVMFTGDQINKPYEKELSAFLPIANMLNVPWFFSFGNHDVCFGGYLTKSLYLDIVNGKYLHFNHKKPYYTFIPKKGFVCIVLDTTIDSRLTSNGEIDKEQLNWLQEQLKIAKDNTVLIFSHVPIKHTFDSEDHRLLNSEEVLQVLKSYNNPIIAFSGHYHMTKVIKDDNVLFVSTPSLVTYPNAYRIININNQKNKVIVDLYLKDTRLTDVQKRAKLRVFASSRLFGEEEDRTWTYEIERGK